MSCVSERALEEVVTALTGKYMELTVNRTSVHEYLGMVLDFSKSGSVAVKMDRYIDSILRESDIDSSASSATPATNLLFKISESPLLVGDQAKDFHSCVMKLMFLAKRARPDILTSVVFLATRVLAPTVEDSKKLKRVLSYLNGTKNLSLNITIDSLLMLYAFIDASFAVHDDMKSHSGIVITMGGGALFVKSMKQKMNSKSSTEAELIALADLLSQVIWTRNLMEAMGYTMEPAEVLQDNLSTIAMIKNGSPQSSRTRHINIRFFFAKDHVERGEIKIVHCPSEDMLADFFTKPLQGELFKKLRAQLMGETL
jgi:hypothetical protein